MISLIRRALRQFAGGNQIGLLGAIACGLCPTYPPSASIGHEPAHAIERTAPARGELQLVGAGQAPRARPRPAPRHPPRAAPTSTSGGRAAVQPAPLVKRFDLCPIGRPDSRARVRPPPWSYQPAFL